MLKNAPTVAIGGVDTQENEHCEVCPLSVYRSPRCSSSLLAALQAREPCTTSLTVGTKYYQLPKPQISDGSLIRVDAEDNGLLLAAHAGAGKAILPWEIPPGSHLLETSQSRSRRPGAGRA